MRPAAAGWPPRVQLADAGRGAADRCRVCAAPVSVPAVWTANQVSDTSRYVANVAPLIKDPALHNALTGKLTSQIVAQIDVKRLTGQVAAELSHKGLPRVGGLLQSFSGSLASGVQGSCTAPSTRSSPGRGWPQRGYR